MVYVYDSGGLYYGGLICNQLPALPYLGIAYETPPDGYGVQVPLDGVVAGSPAAEAGIEPRDVIVYVDGIDISNGTDLDAALALHDPGDVVTLGVEHGGKPLDLPLTLGKEPA